MIRHWVIAVDFDGVIHDAAHPVPGWRMGPPFRGAREALGVLQSAGFEIIVFTANVRLGYVRDWLDHYEIPYNEVTNQKVLADVYVDDKAVRFEGDWIATLAEVQRVLT